MPCRTSGNQDTHLHRAGHADEALCGRSVSEPTSSPGNSPVCVDCAKELPATLLLRPFNYETLATRVHEKASLEDLGNAAPAAILVMAVGLVAVALLARANLGLRQAEVRATSEGVRAPV